VASRVINYSGAIPLDLDLLNTNKNMMIALGMLAQAVFGTSTVADGLAVTPTSPASMTVNVAAGSIYSIQNVDNTAFGSISADTTHQIQKQGINLGTLNLSCPAPGTPGQSINYLVQAIFQETDGGSTVLPYYNASNPAVAYSGPANAGTPNFTVRQGQCSINVLAGTAAATGSQTTPAPTAGYTPLYVVTVANGATTITSGNIAVSTSAPFFTKLPAIATSGGSLMIANNLSDLGSLATALTNLGFVKSLGSSGYQKLPGGLIVQWGTLTTGGSGSDAVTFPITFPNACFGVYPAINDPVLIQNTLGTRVPTTSGVNIISYISYSAGSPTGSGCLFRYTAIGY